MTQRSRHSAGGSQLVLSLFPGIDLFGRGFEAAGFCVVRGPDLIFGGDIREFIPPAGRFDGIIGGSPCPDFSRARRGAPSGDGLAMLTEFGRVVMAAAPAWWLLENVPGCPDLRIDGYGHQRLDVDARDLGLEQRRLRHFQFGHARGLRIALPRPRATRGDSAATCLASNGGGRDFGRFCELQGLPRNFELPGFTLSAKYRAVGNGVHVGVARFLAAAVLRPVGAGQMLCACSCGRPVAGKARAAGPACRKRLERKRRDSAPANEPGPVTVVTAQRRCGLNASRGCD